MLISSKNINESSPPFILVSANGDWLLVKKVQTCREKLIFSIIEKQNNEFSQREIDVWDVPFHVGAEVWELSYGARLMTLNHASLTNHPAQEIWREWLVYNR